MALNEVAGEYFCNMNSMAKRLWTDMEDTKAQYENLWGTLQEEDKNQILNDSIVKPHVFLKYSDVDDNSSKRSEAEKNYATKIIVDDHCSYHDEHSGPFSFHTKSQRDLTLLNQKDKKASFKTPTISKDESVAAAGKLSTNAIVDHLSSLAEKSDSIFSMHSLPRTGLDLLDNW